MYLFKLHLAFYEYIDIVKMCQHTIFLLKQAINGLLTHVLPVQIYFLMQ